MSGEGAKGGLRGPGASFSLASWNVQTFFDGETDGCEYNDFKGAKSAWNREKYRDRLTRLCEALGILNADVVALEELENEGVVQDITNELTGRLARDKLYPYVCFAKKPGSAIGCAVLSRFPITGVTVHQTDWRERVDPIAPDMRPVMEVVIAPGKGLPPVRLFVNHWKSKSGGEAGAAFWQSRQEGVLARRIALAQGDGVVACGDFNRTIGEFTLGDDRRVELRGDFGPPVMCEAGWLMPGVIERDGGSYFYQNAWETIDHVFTAGAAALQSFSAPRDGPWARETDSGVIPYRYVMTSGKGYSDHLPVYAVVTLSRE
jgi:endonuclease/exonuclease/phosphatase family metal-dependent hydrolase